MTHDFIIPDKWTETFVTEPTTRSYEPPEPTWWDRLLRRDYAVLFPMRSEYEFRLPHPVANASIINVFTPDGRSVIPSWMEVSAADTIYMQFSQDPGTEMRVIAVWA